MYFGGKSCFSNVVEFFEVISEYEDNKKFLMRLLLKLFVITKLLWARLVLWMDGWMDE